VLFAIMLLTMQTRAVNAQWTTGTNISNTNSGNVGVGTSNPQYGKLQVNKIIRIDDDSGSANGSDTLSAAPALYLGTTTGGGMFQFNGSGGIDLWQVNTAWARTFTFTKSGSLGIGTTSPTSNLEVQGADAPLTLSQAGVTGKVTLQAAIGTDMHLSANAKYLSSTWNRYDTSLPSWNVFASPTADYAGIRRASAASGAITWIDFFRVTSAGNVGIGTASPLQKLQVGSNTSTATTAPDAISLGATYSSAARANPKLRLFDNNGTSVYGLGVSDSQLDFMIPSAARYVWSVNGVEKMRLDDSGNITVAGSIAAKYQDVAEWVESSQALSAGTVVVLDHTKSNQVIASSQAYDTRVAGVISLQPGITLGEKSESKVLVATTGRVRIKVDASHGAINIGDLLVTSDVPGIAMKSQPIDVGGVRIHRPGTLIGKALEPLASGTGEILTLLSLQ
jgi:hypothetical protein